MPAATLKRRHKPGDVRDAILGYLEGVEDAPVAEIERAVRARVGEVSPSSIRSYLQLNTPETFVRPSRGRYGLARRSSAASRARVERGAGHDPVYSFEGASLYHEDCFNWLAGQPANSVHAVVTDPPYGLVEYSPKELEKLRAQRGGVWRIPPSFDGHQRSPLPRFTTLKAADRASLRGFFLAWAQALHPVLVPGAHVFVASNPLLSHLVADSIERGGFERRGEVIRLVMTMRGGDRPKNAHDEFPGVTVMPRSMWEPWLLFRKPVEGRVSDNLRTWGTGGLRRRSKEAPFGDAIRSAPTRPSERAIAPHPSLKPQSFLRQVVRASLPLGEGVVLDPFAGSGSTLAACIAVGYNGVGVEVDGDFVSVAKRAIRPLSRLDDAATADTPSLF